MPSNANRRGPLQATTIDNHAGTFDRHHSHVKTYMLGKQHPFSLPRREIAATDCDRP
jgi:hypothetical protein